MFWLLYVAVAAVVTPPFIAAHTWLDREKPFWRVFLRRYRRVLFEVFEASAP